MASVTAQRVLNPGFESLTAVHHVGVHAALGEGGGLGVVEVDLVGPRDHLDRLSVIGHTYIQYRDNLAWHITKGIQLSSATPFTLLC